MTAIGEEFVSSLQIFLCELARLNSNFLETNKSISILIEEALDYQQAKNNIEHGRWIVSIPKFESKEQKEISYHYGFISVVIKKIFRSISTFGEKEFEDFWWRVLHEEGKVGKKAFNSNAYQKEYSTAVDSKVFTDSQRAAFPQPPPHLAFERLPMLLVES